MKEKSFVSATVYASNAAAQLGSFMALLLQTLADQFVDYEVICVDDASTDDTVKVLRQAGASAEGLAFSVVEMSFPQGREACMNAAMDLAIGDFVFEFDEIVDTYDAEIIMRAFRRCQEGVDVVEVGPESPPLDQSLFYSFFNRFATLDLLLRPESFRVLSRRAINRAYAISDTVPFRQALYAGSGLKSDHLYYAVNRHKRGTRRHQSQRRWTTALDALILFTDIGHRVSFMVAVLLLVTTVAAGIYTITLYALSRPVAGYTTMMLLISGGLCAIAILLAIAMRYLAVITDLVFRRRRYFVQTIEKIAGGTNE